MNKREGEDTLRTGFTLRTTDECDSARSAGFGGIREEASNELKAFVELRTIVRNASQVRIFKYEIEKKKNKELPCHAGTGLCSFAGVPHPAGSPQPAADKTSPAV